MSEKLIHATFGLDNVSEIGPINNRPITLDSFTVGTDERSISFWSTPKGICVSTNPGDDGQVILSTKEVKCISQLLFVMATKYEEAEADDKTA